MFHSKPITQLIEAYSDSVQPSSKCHNPKMSFENVIFNMVIFPFIVNNIKVMIVMVLNVHVTNGK